MPDPKQLITEASQLSCGHGGSVVGLRASQQWVTIDGQPVLVEGDPVRKTITGCTNTASAMCVRTVAVVRGYSPFVRIDGRPVCLDTTTGPTNGAPPPYRVTDPAQPWVAEVS